jgi:hypothetical protein
MMDLGLKVFSKAEKKVLCGGSRVHKLEKYPFMCPTIIETTIAIGQHIP